jgi:hypothetical protein
LKAASLPRKILSIAPLVRAKEVEQLIGSLEMRKLNQFKMPMPIPTAYGDQRTSVKNSIRLSSSDDQRR